MQCTRPVTLPTGLRVPCGKCIACRDARSREWSLRMMHELVFWDDASFVTLTYSDISLPFHGGLDKRDVVLFLKRFRRSISSVSSSRRVRYYLCGEYGGKTGRPHYHAILFGVKRCGKCRCCSSEARRRNLPPVADSDCQLLEDSWNLGHVDVGDVTYGSVRYVADYIQKNGGEATPGGRPPSFTLMSKGIGAQWMLENSEDLSRDLAVKRGAKMIGLPRYYQKRIARSHGELEEVFSWFAGQVRMRRAGKREEATRDWLTSRSDVVGLGIAWRAMLKQHRANLIGKRQMRERVL